MDTNLIRLICALLAVTLVALIVMRRRRAAK